MPAPLKFFGLTGYERPPDALDTFLSNMPFNPFARSQMKIAAPLQLISSSYESWSDCYQLEYRASRGAANAGLLAKQFKVGTPIVVEGRHLVVRSAALTITNGSVDEISIRVEAVDFASVLAQASGGAPKPVATLVPGALAPVVRGDFGPRKRRILT